MAIQVKVELQGGALVVMALDSGSCVLIDLSGIEGMRKQADLERVLGDEVWEGCGESLSV